jgi:NAD(P)H-hydrate epimerase
MGRGVYWRRHGRERENVGLTRAEVRHVDRVAIERFHVPGVVLMENAALAVLDAGLSMLVDFRVRKAWSSCGGGNNAATGWPWRGTCTTAAST